MSSEADAATAWAEVQANPRNHAAWNFLAMSAVQAGRADLAIGYAERAHQLDRRNGEYLGTLGIALAEAGRLEDGIAALQRAVKLRPASADIRCNLGNALRKARRYPEALECYARAAAIEPRRNDVRSGLGLMMLRVGRNSEALKVLREVREQSADDPDAIVDVANAVSDAEGIEAAVAFLRSEVTRQPEEARLRFRLAQSLLLLGQWDEGWREYLWRPSARLHEGRPSPELLPADLTGKSVLIVPNQGLGDVLFFLRFAAEIPRRGGRVLFHAPAKLAPLLRGQEGVPEVVDSADIPCDFAVGASDLPFVVQARDVCPTLRLKARADLVERWQQALAALGPPPYVGLTWRAGTDPRHNPEFGDDPAELLFKEVGAALLATALPRTPGTLVALQRRPDAGEIDALAQAIGRPLHDFSAANEDLEAMAALLAVLDDYVGVSNTNMHLRAACGRVAKVMVPFPPEFRWMASGDESPWFPGFRIYRQNAQRDWSAALQALRADLAGH